MGWERVHGWHGWHGRRAHREQRSVDRGQGWGRGYGQGAREEDGAWSPTLKPRRAMGAP